MDPAHYGQMQRLTMVSSPSACPAPRRPRGRGADASSVPDAHGVLQLRDATVKLRGRSPSQLHRARGDSRPPDDDRDVRDAPEDPLIYPGVYAPSGFDIVGVLVRLVSFSLSLFPLPFPFPLPLPSPLPLPFPGSLSPARAFVADVRG